MVTGDVCWVTLWSLSFNEYHYGQSAVIFPRKLTQLIFRSSFITSVYGNSDSCDIICCKIIRVFWQNDLPIKTKKKNRCEYGPINIKWILSHRHFLTSAKQGMENRVVFNKHSTGHLLHFSTIIQQGWGREGSAPPQALLRWIPIFTAGDDLWSWAWGIIRFRSLAFNWNGGQKRSGLVLSGSTGTEWNFLSSFLIGGTFQICMARAIAIDSKKSNERVYFNR